MKKFDELEQVLNYITNIKKNTPCMAVLEILYYTKAPTPISSIIQLLPSRYKFKRDQLFNAMNDLVYWKVATSTNTSSASQFSIQLNPDIFIFIEDTNFFDEKILKEIEKNEKEAYRLKAMVMRAKEEIKEQKVEKGIIKDYLTRRQIELTKEFEKNNNIDTRNSLLYAMNELQKLNSFLNRL